MESFNIDDINDMPIILFANVIISCDKFLKQKRKVIRKSRCQVNVNLLPKILQICICFIFILTF